MPDGMAQGRLFYLLLKKSPGITICAFLKSSIKMHRLLKAPVAQLDRALPSEGKGREFESRRVHHLFYALRPYYLPNGDLPKNK